MKIYSIIPLLFLLFFFCTGITATLAETITRKNAVFVFNAYSDNPININHIIQYYMLDGDAVSNTPAEELNSMRADINRYIHASEQQEQFVALKRIAFPEFDKQKSAFRVDLGPDLPLSVKKEIKIVQYHYREPIGIIEIWLTPMKPQVLIPSDRPNTAHSKLAFVQIQGRITKVVVNKSMATGGDIFNPAESTSRKIYIKAESLRLNSLDGRQLGELVTGQKP